MPQVICPACSGANRAPDGKDPKAAECGRRRTPLCFELPSMSANQIVAWTRQALAEARPTSGA